MGKDGGEGWGREGRIKLPEAAGGENMKGSPFSLKDRSPTPWYEEKACMVVPQFTQAAVGKPSPVLPLPFDVTPWSPLSAAPYSSLSSFLSPSLPLPPPRASPPFYLFLNISGDNVFSVAPWETLSPAVAH